MTKRELIKELESVATSQGSKSFYKIDKILSSFGNSQLTNWLWEDVVDAKTLDEMTQREAENGAVSVRIFLKGIEWQDDAYRINGYGNAENLTDSYLIGLVSDLVQMIEDMDDDYFDEEEEEDGEETDEE